MAELFASRYSPALGRVASVLLLCSMVGFGATYVKSLGLLFGPFVPWLPPAAASAGLTLVVLAVALPGGLVTVVRSDVVSFVLTLVMVPILLVAGMWASAGAGGHAAAFDPSQLRVDPVGQWSHPVLPFRFVVTLIALTCFTYIAAPWLRAEDLRRARRAHGVSRGRLVGGARVRALWRARPGGRAPPRRRAGARRPADGRAGRARRPPARGPA